MVSIASRLRFLVREEDEDQDIFVHMETSGAAALRSRARSALRALIASGRKGPLAVECRSALIPSPSLRVAKLRRCASAMGFFKTLFTWWTARRWNRLFQLEERPQVGSDAAGNSYFEAKKGGRRWVMYAGSTTSAVPPKVCLLTRQIEGLPDDVLPPAPRFLKAATPNLTGTADAYRPTGALEKGGRRQAASGDYQAWTPD